MANAFRRLLINVGKAIPFVFALVVSIGYMETLYAVFTSSVLKDGSGDTFYYLPLSDAVANVVYIDLFDVLLLYILAVALEFCRYNRLCVHYLALNLAVRTALERIYVDERLIVPICIVMAAFGLYCTFNGLRKILARKHKIR